jgi:hypothetical protein
VTGADPPKAARAASDDASTVRQFTVEPNRTVLEDTAPSVLYAGSEMGARRCRSRRLRHRCAVHTVDAFTVLV